MYSIIKLNLLKLIRLFYRLLCYIIFHIIRKTNAIIKLAEFTKWYISRNGVSKLIFRR